MIVRISKMYWLKKRADVQFVLWFHHVSIIRKKLMITKNLKCLDMMIRLVHLIQEGNIVRRWASLELDHTLFLAKAMSLKSMNKLWSVKVKLESLEAEGVQEPRFFKACNFKRSMEIVQGNQRWLESMLISYQKIQWLIIHQGKKWQIYQRWEWEMLVGNINQLTLLLEVAQSDKVCNHLRIFINKTKMQEQHLPKQKIVFV